MVEKPEIPTKVLTERNFRTFWRQTESITNNHKRYQRVIDLMQAETLIEKADAGDLARTVIFGRFLDLVRVRTIQICGESSAFSSVAEMNFVFVVLRKRESLTFDVWSISAAALADEEKGRQAAIDAIIEYGEYLLEGRRDINSNRAFAAWVIDMGLDQGKPWSIREERTAAMNIARLAAVRRTNPPDGSDGISQTRSRVESRERLCHGSKGHFAHRERFLPPSSPESAGQAGGPEVPDSHRSAFVPRGQFVQ
jgi:hypothetical protein